MIKLEELQPSLMYTAYIYQFCNINIEPIAQQHVEDLVKKGFVDMSNISDGAHKFQQQRKKFPPPMKLMFD